MIQKANLPSVVPPEEVERRIAEFRQVALQGKSAPQVVYHPPKQGCPWQGCDYRIAGIRFNLDQMGTTEEVERWLVSWWQGPGLLARCPGCRRFVLLSLQNKEAIPDPATTTAPALPDNWDQVAYLVPKSSHQ